MQPRCTGQRFEVAFPQPAVPVGGGGVFFEPVDAGRQARLVFFAAERPDVHSAGGRQRQDVGFLAFPAGAAEVEFQAVRRDVISARRAALNVRLAGDQSRGHAFFSHHLISGLLRRPAAGIAAGGRICTRSLASVEAGRRCGTAAGFCIKLCRRFDPLASRAGAPGGFMFKRVLVVYTLVVGFSILAIVGMLQVGSHLCPMPRRRRARLMKGAFSGRSWRIPSIRWRS